VVDEHGVALKEHFLGEDHCPGRNGQDRRAHRRILLRHHFSQFPNDLDRQRPTANSNRTYTNKPKHAAVANQNRLSLSSIFFYISNYLLSFRHFFTKNIIKYALAIALFDYDAAPN